MLMLQHEIETEVKAMKCLTKEVLLGVYINVSGLYKRDYVGQKNRTTHPL